MQSLMCQRDRRPVMVPDSQKGHWYVLQIKPQRERLTSHSLSRKNVGVYLPELQYSAGSRQRVVCKPLFPGYLFAHFDLIDQLDAVRHTVGVVRLLFSEKNPTPLPEELIRSIIAEAEEYARTDRRKHAQVGDTVAVKDGPFAGMVGKVERRLDGQNRVRVLLDALQRAPVSIEAESLSVEPNA